MIDYPEMLKRLEQAKPEHPLLWVFRRGYTAGNALLLQRELDQLRAPAPVATEMDEDDEPVADDYEDETLRAMRIELSKKFTDRRNCSNSLHECTNDRQRARVSEDIQMIQRRIEGIKQAITDYKQMGQLPEPNEQYPVPADPFRVIALRNSLRASISRKKREIEDATRDNYHHESDKIKKAEAKLKELVIHLQHVKKAIDDRDIQS